MLSPIAPTYRPPGKRRPRRLPPPRRAELTLVAAAYDFALHRIDLTFDRAVSIAAMDVTQIQIDDSDSGNRYQGSGTPTLTAPATVRVNTTLVGPVSVPNTFLTAGAQTGIVAENDGRTWDGVTEQQVPFS
jgi:hypothetical protein